MMQPVSCGDLFTDNIVKYLLCLFSVGQLAIFFLEIVLFYLSVH